MKKNEQYKLGGSVTLGSREFVLVVEFEELAKKVTGHVSVTLFDRRCFRGLRSPGLGSCCGRYPVVVQNIPLRASG
jgi:hypothetical protein